MGRKVEKNEKGLPAVDPESEEKKRLRSLAVSKKILRRTPAKASATLEPSKAFVKLQGRDIVKRGQRKSRYLFSFPGLIAPISGGKIGELANLATKNPILYLEFPQGRIKLFGTHVYPKNKYLTLQLTKSSKGVMCEDVFESLIVFSEAWWIGREEENPEEYQLEFPKDLKECNDSDYNFKGGAGAICEEASGGQKHMKENLDPQTPDDEIEHDCSDDIHTIMGKDEKKIGEITPLRQSARMLGKASKVSYAESFCSEDSSANDNEAIEMDEVDINVDCETKSKRPSFLDIDDLDVTASPVRYPEEEALIVKEDLSEKMKQAPQNSIRKSPRKTGTLVQARLPSLFGKVYDKKTKRAVDDSTGTKCTAGKRQRFTAKEKAETLQAKALSRKGNSCVKNGIGTKSPNKRKQPQKKEDGDWSEDISSDSQDKDEDEDWTA